MKKLTKREAVSILMLSPLYFSMLIEARLVLVNEYMLGMNKERLQL